MPPTTDDFVVNNVWATNSPAGTGEKVTCPSGQTVVARKMGIDGMLESGILMGIESLAGLVMEGPVAAGQAKLQGYKKPAKQQAAVVDEADMLRKVMADPDMLKNLITMADRAVPHIVLEPRVDSHQINIAGKPHMRSATQREPGVIYTDQISFEDKMFLFTWSTGMDDEEGGTEPLAEFREGSGDAVDAVGAESGVPLPTKRAGRKRR